MTDETGAMLAASSPPGVTATPALPSRAHIVEVEVGEQSTAAEVLRAGIAASVLRLLENDAVIRADDDVEGIHQARVACRRLRSDLRTFAPLLDVEWAEPLRDELRWLAGALGAVRDLDVLRARLERQLAALPAADAAAGRAALGRLARERADAQGRAVAVLESRRYLDLLERLAEAAVRPATSADADQPAVDVLPALARPPYRRLRTHVRRLSKHPSDEALHDLRIQAKRARYAADVAVPVVGKPARRYVKALGRLQDVLGDLHDCVVAEQWLRDTAVTSDGPTAFVLGELVAAQRQELEDLRRRWRPVWDEVAGRERTGWMR